MNEIERLQQLAGIVNEAETGDETEKTVVGHVDSERDMIRKQVFQMGTYSVELFRMMNELPEDADLPHWWQSKVVKAAEYLSAAKHYLENELTVPDAPTQVSPDITDDQDPSGVS